MTNYLVARNLKSNLKIFITCEMLFGQQAHQKLLTFFGMDKEQPPRPPPKKRKSKTDVNGPEAKVMKPNPNTESNVLETDLTAVLKVSSDPALMDQIYKKYPVLKNADLVQRFLNVSMTNNQKGRIRTLVRDSLKNSSGTLEPDVINNKLQSIINSNEPLTDTDLRKIRILYNMLKTAAISSIANKKPKREPKNREPLIREPPEVDPSEASEALTGSESNNTAPGVQESLVRNRDDRLLLKRDPKAVNKNKQKPGNNAKKPRGPKRYVVFVGNLPQDINKEKLMQHFSDIGDNIKDVRIPEPMEGKLSRIAFLEVSGGQTYEVALSKHHSMLDNKRINVLYTTQNKGKVTTAEAKSKTAKLVAMQKSGKLIGSIPLTKKRSQRRAKQRAAAKAEAQAEPK